MHSQNERDVYFTEYTIQISQTQQHIPR